MLMSNEAIGQSHAKIIFLGEHSAVYQKPAIVFPLPQVKVNVTIKPNYLNESTIFSTYFTGPISELPSSMHGLASLIDNLNNELNNYQTHFDIHIISEIPLGRGMGSSAAISAAIIRAYFAYFSQSLDSNKLNNLINIEESITHGNPSGIDAKTVVSDQPILFENSSFLRISFNTTGYIIIADTGISSNTKTAVDEVRNRLNENPQIVKKQIETLGDLTEKAKQTLNDNDILATGSIMNAAQHTLNNLGVSSSEIDQLISVALENGAVGAKLTGSGMGGCIIALVSDLNTAQSMQKKLLKQGAKAVWIQSLNEIN